MCIRLITPLILIYLLAQNCVTELTRGTLYGVTGTAFDRYLAVAPITFVSLFVIAFALAQRWTNLALITGGCLTYAVASIWLPLTAAICCGIAVALLFGGLAVCLRIAIRQDTQEVDGS